MDPRLKRLVRIARDVVVPALQKAAHTRQRTGRTSSSGARSTPASSTRSGTGVTMPSFDRGATTSSHVDARRGEVDTATARPKVAYAPVRDDDADPGEVVWAWVPYEEDPTQGKDRPLLVIGHIEDDVAALALTSRAHDDRHHHPLGTGPWDNRGRPSWIKLDRLLRLDPDAIRREGAVLDRNRFDGVVAAWEAY